MTIYSEITRKDYSKLMTIHLSKTPYMIIAVILGLAFVGFYFQYPESGQYYLLIGLALIGLPVLTFFTIGQAYDKNKHFNEKIEFFVEDHDFEMVGQTFRSSFTWDKITKVKEHDKFFSLHQGRVMLTVINKESNTTEAVEQLRTFLRSRNKLRN